jgi:hypothetical protein
VVLVVNFFLALFNNWFRLGGGVLGMNSFCRVSTERADKEM